MTLQNQCRIIAGKWRGRKIHFSSEPGLRPTPDRVRETLFNWLAPHIAGSHCLDLFAGSGALGFEALSRGSELVQLVDSSRVVTKQLQQTLDELQATNGSILTANAAHPIPKPEHPFDIVFLDPPFNQDLLNLCIAWLNHSDYLAPNAHVYIEVEKKHGALPLPSGWEIVRNKVAGQVAYCLVVARLGYSERT